MVDQAEIDRLWDAGPPAGMGLADWMRAMILLEWRGADEDPVEIGTRPNSPPESVRCVCGAYFTFKQGGIGAKARCPGCGARHVTVQLYFGSTPAP